MVKNLIVMLVFCLVCASFAFAAETADNIYISKNAGGRISFRLKNADIKTVLQIFSKQIGVNVVAGDEITGKVTMAFTNVKPMDGLDAILRVKGYNWTQEGETIVVTTEKAVKTYSLQFANATEVEGSIKPLLGQGDSVSINESYNQIIIKASSDKIGVISKAIGQIDIPQTQVVVEAHIVEVKRSDDGTIGADLKVSSSRDPNDIIQTLNFAGRGTSGSPLGLYAQVVSGNYESYLSAVLQEQNYNVVASPRITTINHKEASILIGEKLGYQTSTTTTTGTTTTIKFLETGTKLVLTPHVSNSGFIRMVIEPKVSEGSVDKSTGIPNENTTETKNEVVVKDNQTIVIGGLIKKKETQTETGVPILMHIPFLGMLFKKNVISNENRELIIFIRPRILTPEYMKTMGQDIKDLLEKEEERKSTIIN